MKEISKKIIAFRHGETEWNRLGIIQGITDMPLNDKGLNQAEVLAMRLGCGLNS